MTILDKLLEFSDAQALASISSGSSTVSTVVPDLGANGEDGWGDAKTNFLGVGGKLIFEVGVNTALVGAGAALDCVLVTKAADASISSGATTLATLQLPAVSAAGTRKAVAVPVGTNIERYIGVLYTANGAALTSAKIDSFISFGGQESR